MNNFKIYCCFCGRDKTVQTQEDFKYVCDICIKTCMDIMNNPNWDCQREENKKD